MHLFIQSAAVRAFIFLEFCFFKTNSSQMLSFPGGFNHLVIGVVVILVLFISLFLLWITFKSGQMRKIKNQTVQYYNLYFVVYLEGTSV